MCGRLRHLGDSEPLGLGAWRGVHPVTRPMLGPARQQAQSNESPRQTRSGRGRQAGESARAKRSWCARSRRVRPRRRAINRPGSCYLSRPSICRPSERTRAPRCKGWRSSRLRRPGWPVDVAVGSPRREGPFVPLACSWNCCEQPLKPSEDWLDAGFCHTGRPYAKTRALLIRRLHRMIRRMRLPGRSSRLRGRFAKGFNFLRRVPISSQEESALRPRFPSVPALQRYRLRGERLVSFDARLRRAQRQRRMDLPSDRQGLSCGSCFGDTADADRPQRRLGSAQRQHCSAPNDVDCRNTSAFFLARRGWQGALR